MPSRDALTRSMMGDPFGGVGGNSRAVFALGDPGLGSFLKKAAGKGVRALASHYGVTLPSRRSPSSLMARPSIPAGVGPGAEIGADASGAMVRMGGGLRSRARAVGAPRTARIQTFPASVYATHRRRRHMNVGNIKALRKAERRLASFVKLAHRIVAFHKTHHLKRHGRKR